MKTINVSEETYEKIRNQIEGEKGKKQQPCDDIENMVGKKYFFRAVTYHLVGRVEYVWDTHTSILRLSGASWVADSGRFMNAITDGTLSEVEPVGEAYINLDAVIDFFPWNHPLPTEQK